MKKEIVTPIQNRPLLHSEPTTVPFVRARVVRVLLFHLQRQLKELPPRFPRLLHQFVADAVVNHLKEPPLPAGVRDHAQRGLAHLLVVSGQGLQVNNRDVDGGVFVGEVRGSFGRGLDVELRDCFYPTFGEGLDPDDRLRPALQTLHHRSSCERESGRD